MKEVIKERIEGERGRGKPRMMTLDDIKADETDKKNYVKPWIENVGEAVCTDPSFKQVLPMMMMINLFF